jgi:hypothetical protein
MKTLAACIALLFITVLEIPSGHITELMISENDDTWHLSFSPDGTAMLGFSNSACDIYKFPCGALPPLEVVYAKLAAHLLNAKGTTGSCVSISRGETITLPQYPDAEAERYIRDLFQQAFAKAKFSNHERIAELLKKYPLN